MSDADYICLTATQLQTLCLVHCISGMDEDVPTPISAGAVQTVITGYTEWTGAAGSLLSIGWDWQMLADKHSVLLKRVSMPSSNLMLHSASHAALGAPASTGLLASFIDGVAWQDETLQHLRRRYAASA
jgi:hypothetical protein